MTMLYMDAAATTPVRRQVLESMWPYLTEEFGNPSSHHQAGERARAGLDHARRSVASVLGCRPGEIVFTSGGTEANNLALKGICLAAAQRQDTGRARRIVTSGIEHPAILESARYLVRHHGFEHDVVGVDKAGIVDRHELEAALAPGAALCSIMYANNEVGTVQPLAEIAKTCQAHGVPLHTDAVQAAGWMPLDVTALGVDALSLSGHKLGAPKGSGVLYLRRRVRAEPVIHGGGQERDLRSGTENVAGAVALARALELAEAERQQATPRAARLRDRFIGRVLDDVGGALVTGHRSERLPSLASFCFPAVSGESVLLELERRGVTCSSGSACDAGSDEPSPVLLAMGIEPAAAQTAVRFSWSAAVTEAQIDEAARAVADSVRAVRGLAGGILD